MPTSYTPLLGLALPVTGELSGTWGDTVNDYITEYLDAAVAGAQTISGSQTAVTLSTANGTSLTQAGTGATGSAQYQIINCTGNPASLLTITAPAASKVYLVINATSTSQSVKVVGTGPTTGVTIASSENALIAWNGSDFVKVASSLVDGVSTISFGTTGLTPAVATSGAVTVAGTLAVANGGTGQSSAITQYGVVYGASNTAMAVTAAGTSAEVLHGNGSGAPTWGPVSLVADVAGTLPIANGGTGQSSALTQYGVIYGSSTTAMASTASGATFQVLHGNGGGAPTWGPVFLDTEVAGTLPIANGGTGANTQQAAINALAGATTSGQYLRGNGTSVVMSAIQAGDVPTLNQNTTGTAANVTGTVAIANGGTGATTNSGARTNLGATTVGSNFFTLTNPSAITFPRINADNTVSALDAATFRTAIGAGTGGGSVTSVSFTGGIVSVANPTTTPALTVAGSSGGIPYFSSPTGWASSGTLAPNALVVGGGAGAAPSTITTGTGVVTAIGNTANTSGGLVTQSGTLAANSLLLGGGASTAISSTTTGTGVVTALGVNTGTAGAFVVNGGALGTPSSGTVTNLTGTASININGTVGATSPTTGAFTTLSASDAVTFSATIQNINLGTSQTSGTMTIGGSSQTGPNYIARSSKTFIADFAGGPTENGATKTVNIGTAGLSGSTTNIIYGSAESGSTVLHVWNCAGEKMRLSSAGLLGLGITPSYKLDMYSAASNVATAIRAQSGYSTSLLLAANNTTPGTSSFDIENSGTGGVINQRSNLPIIFYTNNSEKARITGDGNLTVSGSAATPPVAVTFSATAMTVNCNLSNVFTTTFTANVTTAPTISSPQNGQTINWFITQDSTGSRTMTWPTSFKWPGGIAGVLSTAANSVDLVTATYRSATGFWYASLLKAFS